MEKGWIKAGSFTLMYQAELARQMLANHDIESIIINKKDSSYNDFGDIELYVRQSDILWAKKLLNSVTIE